MTAVTPSTIPGYVAGIWDIDATHSHVSFSVRHLMVSKVRGRFNGVCGRLVTGTDPLDSSVTAEIDVNSVDTGNAQRDEHLRSSDFLHAAKFPTMAYRSTRVRRDGDDLVVDGELTVRGITRPVPLAVELTGFGPDPYGGTRVGLSATAKINRKDFDIDTDLPLDGGGVVIGDTVQISLDIEAVLQTA
ncbi:MAG: polyisoprenoid-binding protein [Pseudonocardiales bacterium]|nr:polyisoprenoid-binding protein [Pseudonocardiales bacterium]MBV9030686.1 polyisoprenoid-binding protein [Pseudonocardiales bacterium]